MDAAEAEQPQRDLWGIMRQSLGIAKDVIGVGAVASRAGFNVAASVTDASFRIPRAVITHGGRAAGLEAGAEPLDALIGAIHTNTVQAISTVGHVTGTALEGTHRTLGAAGIEGGQLASTLLGEQLGSEMVTLVGLVQRVMGEVGPIGPVDLVSALGRLKELHTVHSKEIEDGRDRMPPQQLLEGLRVYMRYTAGTYPPAGLKVLGIVPNNQALSGMAEALMYITGCERAEVLSTFSGGGHFDPSHLVALDTTRRAVVVAIRGTMSVGDTVSDLACDTASMAQPWGDGRVHRGFLECAQRINARVHETVRTALQNNPGYKVVLCGHSLGAACAAVLCEMWAGSDAFGVPVRAFCYGPPCVFDAELALCSTPRVVSLIAGHDLVSRMSLRTTQDLIRSLHVVKADPTIPSTAALREKLPLNDEPALYPPGVLVHVALHEDGTARCGPRVAQPEEFSELLVLPAMFSHHMPQVYVSLAEALPPSG